MLPRSSSAAPLTHEQQAPVEYDDDCVVIAVAGAGKTHLLIEYCRRRPHARILYLAYNRTIKDEVTRRLKAAGVTNVRVETLHSLAHKDYDVSNRFVLHPAGGYRVNEIVDLFDLERVLSGKSAFTLAKHVLDFINLYCNSRVRRIEDVDYLSTIAEGESRAFAQKHMAHLEKFAFSLLRGMYQKSHAVTHDAYLKFFSMENPVLEYTHIILDEGQDASGVMLDIILNQKGKKVLVGDPAQQIYAYRHALNSLGLVNFPRFSLSRSFRFNQAVANLAMDALQLKDLADLPREVLLITGTNEEYTGEGAFGVISRSNLALLDQAINDLEVGYSQRIHFEGGMENYSFLGKDGMSIYDVLWLYCKKPEKAQSPFIGSFSSFHELREYQAEAGDPELGVMIKIITKYGPELFRYFSELKKRQVPRKQAERIYSTTHRCKGLEYASVLLTDDFINGDKIRDALGKPSTTKKKKQMSRAEMNEAINLLYVALTRTRTTISMPFSIDPCRSPSRRSF